MAQTVLAGQNFNKSAEILYCLYRTLINSAYLGFFNNKLNSFLCGISRFLVECENMNCSVLVDVNLCTCISHYALDYFSTLSDYFTNLFRVD